MSRFAAALGLLISIVSWHVAPALQVQTPSTDPAFDVASVKPNTSGDWRKSIGPAPGGRFLATNNTLKDLIPFAYGLPRSAA